MLRMHMCDITSGNLTANQWCAGLHLPPQQQQTRPIRQEGLRPSTPCVALHLPTLLRHPRLGCLPAKSTPLTIPLAQLFSKWEFDISLTGTRECTPTFALAVWFCQIGVLILLYPWQDVRAIFITAQCSDQIVWLSECGWSFRLFKQPFTSGNIKEAQHLM